MDNKTVLRILSLRIDNENITGQRNSATDQENTGMLRAYVNVKTIINEFGEELCKLSNGEIDNRDMLRILKLRIDSQNAIDQIKVSTTDQEYVGALRAYFNVNNLIDKLDNELGKLISQDDDETKAPKQTKRLRHQSHIPKVEQKTSVGK